MAPRRTAARVLKGGTVTVTGLPLREGQDVEVIVLLKGSDADRYARAPVAPGEFDDHEDPLGWDGEGWEGFA